MAPKLDTSRPMMTNSATIEMRAAGSRTENFTVAKTAATSSSQGRGPGRVQARPRQRFSAMSHSTVSTVSHRANRASLAARGVQNTQVAAVVAIHSAVP